MKTLMMSGKCEARRKEGKKDGMREAMEGRKRDNRWLIYKENNNNRKVKGEKILWRNGE